MKPNKPAVIKMKRQTIKTNNKIKGYRKTVLSFKFTLKTSTKLVTKMRT